MSDRTMSYRVNIIRDRKELTASFDLLRILYVVEGSCNTIMPKENVHMQKSDMLLLNPMEEARIEPAEQMLLSVLEIPYFNLLEETGRAGLRFYLDSTKESESRIVELKHIIRGLLICFLGESERTLYEGKGFRYFLIQKLLNEFSVSEASERGSQRNETTQEMLRYIWMNYRSEISLTEIADMLFISRSTASRMFKHATGEDFPEYVKNLRLQVVLSELKNTNHSITEIAYSAGFSSVAVLNRVFRESYGMSPRKYRETITSDADTIIPTPDRDQVLQILQSEEKLRVSDVENVTQIHIPVNKGEHWNGFGKIILNIGPIILLRSASMQKQMLFLLERMKIDYIRLWSLFSDSLRMFDDRNGGYNFSLIDEILDFCVDHQMNIMLDLTIRKDRFMASENREIYISPLRERFRDLSSWLSALESLLKHLKSRYHEATLRNWVFELTAFLSDAPYHEGKDYSCTEVWEKSHEIIRRIIPTSKIAGPGFLPDTNMENQLEVIRHFINSSKVPDIFTSLHFPYKKSGIIDSRGYYEKNPDRNYLISEISTIRKVLNESDFRGEYWITDYGISPSNRNYLQDSCYRAATTVDELLQILDHVDGVGIFFASDLMSAFSDTMAELFGSGGILTRNGIRKPVYYAFRFLRQLSNIRLAVSPNCCATAIYQGDIQILCWNRKHLSPRYYMVDEDSFGIDDIPDLLENTNSLLLQLHLTGLEQSKYRIRQRVLNPERGSVLKKWAELAMSLT